MMELFEQVHIDSVITGLVSAVVIAFFWYMFSQIKQIAANVMHIQTMRDEVCEAKNLQVKIQTLSLATARSLIIQQCNDAIKNERLDEVEREALRKLYEGYKQNGGNGSVEERYELAMSQPWR